MKNETIEQCEQDLAAIAAADKLNESVKADLAQFENIDTQQLLSKAAKLLMTGNLSLEALGLSPQLFERIRQLDVLNSVARDKLRCRIEDEKQCLADAEAKQ